jgi:hypothetical protein
VRKVDLAVAAVVVVATAAAMVVLPALDDDEPEVLPAPSGEVVEIHPDGLDHDPGKPVMDPGQPLVCLVDLDCLLQEVEEAAAAAPAAEADAATVPSETPLPPTA